MRAILAVLNRPETASAVLATAWLTAQRLPGARIDVLQLRLAEDPSFLPTEEIMTPARQAQFEAASARLSEALRAALAAWRRALPQPDHVTWRELRGEPGDIIAGEGRKADLIVIGRAAHHVPGDGHAAIEAALFAAGAPVLLAPDGVPAALGAHIAVAWKPAEAAERAIVAATPLLRGAARVTVLTTADGGSSALPGDVRAAMAGQGAAVRVHLFAGDQRAIGASLLREAHAVGADLLVMGAYSRRPSVEYLLGGATRDILAQASLPVFLHH